MVNENETNLALVGIEPVAPEPSEEDLACAQQFRVDQSAVYGFINDLMNEHNKLLTWDELMQFHANDVEKARAFLDAQSEGLETIYE